MTKEFKAFCARGHDRIDFTEREPFETHMATEHGARKPYAGMGLSPRYGLVPHPSALAKPAPGWGMTGKPLEPHPWVAPKPTRGGLTKVQQRIARGEYRWTSSTRWIPDEPAAEIPTDQWVTADL